MQHRKIQCPYHQHCFGEAAYEFYDNKNQVKPFIRCSTDFRTKKDMLASVYAEALSRYLILNGKIVERAQVCYKTFFNFYLNLYTNKSQILLRKLTDHTNGYLIDPVIPSPFIEHLVKRVSAELMFKLTGIRDVKKGTLAEKAYRAYSVYSLIYEKVSPFVDDEGQYVGEKFDRIVYTTANMSPMKQVLLLKEYECDTCLTGEPWLRIRKLFAPAYEILLDYLDLKKHFNTFEFKYNPENLFFFNWNTGAGIIPGPSGEVDMDGIKVRIHNSGKKAYLWEANMRAFHMFMILTALQKKYPYFDLEVIRQKREWKKLMATPTMEKLMKLIMSMREFFIPSMFHSFMGHTLSWFMKYILTGTYITVGLNFMHGGAYNVAKLLSYDIPGQRYGKGDIYKLDKHIQRIFLEMYCGTAYLCYRMDNKTKRAQNYLRTLFKYYSYHMVNKIVLHLGGFWRMEMGKLYSGGLETSMVGSFAMLFLFCLFLVHTMNRYPSASPYIKRCILLRLIAMIVYGDDHIWTWPDMLQDILNTREFAEFLKEYFSMTLREIDERKSLLAKVDPLTGQADGLLFLQRYFIENKVDDSLPPVIAYKDTRTIITSLCLKEFNVATGEDIDAVDMLLSCIGQAYDAQLNKIAYDTVKDMYELVIANHSIINPGKQLHDYVYNPDKRLKVSKILRRVGMTDRDLLCVFPTWDSIIKRGRLDMPACAFGQRRNNEYFDFSTLEETYNDIL